MALELIISHSIREYENEQLKQEIFKTVDRFLDKDFGTDIIHTLAKYKLEAMNRSFKLHAHTAIGIYKAEGITGYIMIIFDEYFSKAMMDLYHYEKSSLIIIRESEFPYKSPDPIRELSDSYIESEKQRQRRLQ